MYNIKHLEGRYSYDPDIDKIWGHFEDGFLEEVDDKVELRVLSSGQGKYKFKEYLVKDSRNSLSTVLMKIPVDKLEYYDSKAKVYKKIDRGNTTNAN